MSFRLAPFLTASVLLLSSHPASAQEVVRYAREGRLDRVQALVAADPTLVRATDPQGYTALRWAGIRGHGQVLRFLLEAGSDPNSVGADGGTPLHAAAHHDDAQAMALLLEAGGDPGVANRWGRTPLHVAARRGCPEVACILLDAGADPNATTLEGWSTLNDAYRGGHPELVELLLARGADPDLADAAGLRPGSVTLVRPPATAVSRPALDAYVGRYDLGEGGGFDVWRVGDALRLQEHAPDVLLPVAPDTFYCRQEPWRVVFHRDDDGTVTRMEVAFQRQTVWGERVRDPLRGFSYLGSAACLSCHAEGPGDGPAGHWIASRHSRALHTLTTDQARGLVRSRPEYQDIQDPSAELRCRHCHVTAAGNPLASTSPDFNPGEGVGCESCHGPGSAYANREVMGSRETFLARGGRLPDELTCRECHRDEGFRFIAYLERIRHWGG